MRAYHFVGATLRDGRPIPPDGEWLEHVGPLKLCSSGLHASKHTFDALQYAPGATVCLVEVDGDIIEDDDKLVASKRKIIARRNATDMLRAFARAQALSVIHLWCIPQVVREYLETGDESIRVAAWAAARNAALAAAWAAWDAALAAAWDAALATARNAALAAARNATWVAAWDAARDDFARRVDELFADC